MIYRAISIQQPWAALIVRGHKPVENRTWSTRYRGPILIHAGKTVDIDKEVELYEMAPHLIGLEECVDDDAEFDPDWITYTSPARPTGGIVGRANLVDVVVAHDSPYFVGPFGFVLENAEPLPFKACRGQLGIFRVEYP